MTKIFRKNIIRRKRYLTANIPILFKVAFGYCAFVFIILNKIILNNFTRSEIVYSNVAITVTISILSVYFVYQ